MTYRIQGLRRDIFAPLFALSDAELADRCIRRVRADTPCGFPCRIGLEDAAVGDSLLLLNFASHDVPTPFRTTYAIFVREGAGEAPCYEDELPPMLDRRTLGLRAFDTEGMLRDGALANPGEADRAIRALFERDEIASIHAHNAAYGCFLAHVERN